MAVCCHFRVSGGLGRIPSRFATNRRALFLSNPTLDRCEGVSPAEEAEDTNNMSRFPAPWKAIVSLIFLNCALLNAQTAGQPPTAACKPGGFTVVNYPDEVGPVEASGFDVFIDERFQGEFQTQARIWLPAILSGVEKWNGIPGSTWNFNVIGQTSEPADFFDGKLTISACGGFFACPDQPPPDPPANPGSGDIDFFPRFQSGALAVTLIVEDLTARRAVIDGDIYFNPGLPFEVNPGAGQFDFETVLLHELGHSIGIDHNDNCTADPTIMESVIGLNDRKRTLTSNEIEAAKFLYPDDSAAPIRIYEQDRVLSFEAEAGGFLPFGQSAPIYGLSFHRWKATPRTDTGDWLSANPPGGFFNGDSQFEVDVDHRGLTPGSYVGFIDVIDETRPGPAVTFEVRLTVSPEGQFSQPPVLTSLGVVNGANQSTPSLAPGSLITLFGENLATATAQAQAFPLPTRLGGTEVIINGRVAPVLFVSQGQINAVVPYEIQPGRGGIIIRTPIGQNRGTPFNFIPAAPELFMLDPQQALAINQDGSLNSADNPASGDTVITLFLTGPGPVEPTPPSGQAASFTDLSEVISESRIVIGGRAAVVEYFGLTPGFAGLAQANVRAPAGITGNLPVRVTVGDQTSGTGFVVVQ